MLSQRYEFQVGLPPRSFKGRLHYADTLKISANYANVQSPLQQTINHLRQIIERKDLQLRQLQSKLLNDVKVVEKVIRVPVEVVRQKIKVVQVIVEKIRYPSQSYQLASSPGQNYEHFVQEPVTVHEQVQHNQGETKISYKKKSKKSSSRKAAGLTADVPLDNDLINLLKQQLQNREQHIKALEQQLAHTQFQFPCEEDRQSLLKRIEQLQNERNDLFEFNYQHLIEQNQYLKRQIVDRDQQNYHLNKLLELHGVFPQQEHYTSTPQILKVRTQLVQSQLAYNQLHRKLNHREFQLNSLRKRLGEGDDYQDDENVDPLEQQNDLLRKQIGSLRASLNVQPEQVEQLKRQQLRLKSMLQVQRRSHQKTQQKLSSEILKNRDFSFDEINDIWFKFTLPDNLLNHVGNPCYKQLVKKYNQLVNYFQILLKKYKYRLDKQTNQELFKLKDDEIAQLLKSLQNEKELDCLILSKLLKACPDSSYKIIYSQIQSLQIYKHKYLRLVERVSNLPRHLALSLLDKEDILEELRICCSQAQFRPQPQLFEDNKYVRIIPDQQDLVIQPQPYSYKFIDISHSLLSLQELLLQTNKKHYQVQGQIEKLGSEGQLLRQNFENKYLFQSKSTLLNRSSLPPRS